MKKILAFILTLILLFQAMLPVSAATTVVSDSKAPDYDVWMADALIQGMEKSTYKMFREAQEPVYRMLGSELLDDKPLVCISTAWSIFFNSEYRNQFANEQKYIYEIILMDYLKYGASTDVLSNEITGNNFKFAKKLYSSLSEELNNNTIDYINENLSVDEAKKIWKNAKIIDGISVALDELDDGVGTVKTLIEELSQYLALKEIKENKITLLKASRSAAENNTDYKRAVDDIIKVLTDTDIDYVQDRSLKYLWNQILDEAWGILTNANPILKTIEYGVSGLDVMFDMKNSSSNNLKLALLYTIDCYMFLGMTNSTQSFLSNKSNVNARKFRECFEAYAQFQMFGNEFAKGWIGQYLNGGVLKDIFNNIFHRENIKTAKELLQRCQTQINYRKTLLGDINMYSGIYKNRYPISEKIPEGQDSSITINKGKTKQFTINNLESNATITYSSSNNKIASVSTSGMIKGKKHGEVIITAKIVQNNKTYYIKMTVNVYDENIGWYEKVLDSNSGVYNVRYQSDSKILKKKVRRADFSYYATVDLNNDGVKELILATDRNNDLWRDNRVLLLTYYDHKVKPLICFEGYGYRGRQTIYKDKLKLDNSGSDFGYSLYVTVSKGKLKVLQQIEYYRIKNKIPYYNKYYVNGRKVTENTYKKAFNKYPINRFVEIKYQRIY